MLVRGPCGQHWWGNSTRTTQKIIHISYAYIDLKPCLIKTAMAALHVLRARTRHPNLSCLFQLSVMLVKTDVFSRILILPLMCVQQLTAQAKFQKKIVRQILHYAKLLVHKLYRNACSMIEDINFCVSCGSVTFYNIQIPLCYGLTLIAYVIDTKYYHSRYNGRGSIIQFRSLAMYHSLCRAGDWMGRCSRGVCYS